MDKCAYAKVHYLDEFDEKLYTQDTNFYNDEYLIGDEGEFVFPKCAKSAQICYSIVGVDECSCNFCTTGDPPNAEIQYSFISDDESDSDDSHSVSEDESDSDDSHSVSEDESDSDDSHSVSEDD